MNEWIINYDNDGALKVIKDTGIVLFEPEFEDLRFIIMKTYLSKETILKIDGVTECRKPMVGTIYVDVATKQNAIPRRDDASAERVSARPKANIEAFDTIIIANERSSFKR